MKRSARNRIFLLPCMSGKAVAIPVTLKLSNLLIKRGIPFSEKLLKAKQDVEAFKQLSGIDVLFRCWEWASIF